MSTTNVTPPFDLFTDDDGQPLDAGFIYIGTANADPVSNPVAIYWDAALTIPASQPVRTINGFPSRSGSPGRLFVASNFSITVKDKKGVQQLTNPSGGRAGLGSIVLVATESLTAETGATIALNDGSTLRIGDDTGTGVVVTVAPNARFVGDLIPEVTGTQVLGSATRKWDAHLDLATVTTVSATTINGTTVAGYVDDTSPATAIEALALNQQKNVVACGRISSAGAVGTNHFNITSATPVGNTLVATLDQAIDDDAVVIVQPTGTSTGLEARASVAAGGATITFTMYTGGVAGLLNIVFVAFGRPRGGVTQP